MMKIKKWNNETTNEVNDFATLMDLQIDEIHTQLRHLLQGKNCVLVPSHDDAQN